MSRKQAMVQVGADGKPVRSRVSGYDWFAVKPVGAIGAEMIPVILFRILPELAKQYGETDPEEPARPLFGEPEEKFAKFGFWPDTRPDFKDRPLPMGFAWTPGRPSSALPLSLIVRTCGSCHTGRVRLEDGSIRVLVGALNTEILLHQYDAAIGSFFTKHLADEASAKAFQADVLTLVATKQQDPNFFFKNAPGYDAQEEARQIEVFKALLGQPGEKGGILANIERLGRARATAEAKLKDVAYSKLNSPVLAGGPPALIDSSGLGIAAFVVPFGLDAKTTLFTGATKNDVPSVWDQRTRKQFQWDGNICDILARNLVAALGLVGKPDKMDITANFLISDFIDGLPSAPYPFAVDLKLARKQGRAVYERNCLACHQPDQHRGDGKPVPIFHDLGTDGNRAQVVTPGGYEVIKKAVVACYQPADLTFTWRGKVETPNRNVDSDTLLIKRFVPADQGYVAPPLDGIWVRAPYLHNGSVPTLRHLLAPSLRLQAKRFVRGAISYDQHNVGWSWEETRLAELRVKNLSARLYNTAEDGQSNAGHDQKEWIDAEGRVGPKGASYRLAWDDPNDPVLEALLEYLKTF